MADKPLFIFPNPTAAPRPTGLPRFGPLNYHYPDVNRQKVRLAPQFEAMRQAFVTDTTAGIEPENVLVMETIGKIEDFARAVRAVPGLEWLAEIDTDEIEPDEDFYQKPKIGKRIFYKEIEEIGTKQSSQIWDVMEQEAFIDKDGFLIDRNIDEFASFIPEEVGEFGQQIIDVLKSAARPSEVISGRLFLSMSNRQAMNYILSLWRRWHSGRKLPYGSQKWAEVFLHLKKLRPWDVTDRLRETGVKKYWQENLNFYQSRNELIPFEIEIWYRNIDKRQAAYENIRQLIQSENGRIISACTIEEIHFHALKAELPPDKIKSVLASHYFDLFHCQDVMFFRPTGQCAIEALPDGELGEFVAGEVSGDPVVAILDGDPFVNHDLLRNRLNVEDPDDFGSSYQAKDRKHGTTIASLICHGELDAKVPPLTMPVYIRPIMKPDEDDLNRREHIPKDQFFEDLVERSVRRMFEGEGDEGPTAPTIKIVNIAIGDPNKMFFHRQSSCARLLDWLSYKYGVLFCVSGGNVHDDINMGISENQFSGLTDEQRTNHTVAIIHNDIRNRRIISPGESINSITVGAMHGDHSTINHYGHRTDILPNQLLPSPISSHGHGFRSSIKPEIYLAGGRQLYSHMPSGNYEIIKSSLAPGQKVAAAPVSPGETGRFAYCCGTSNAVALASRAAAQIYESLQELQQESHYTIPDENIAVLLKTLLVHSASWGDSKDVLERCLGNGVNRTTLTRYLGYGIPDIQRVLECTWPDPRKLYHCELEGIR